MSVKDFSTTPASNATVGSINFAELQNPSTLNDSARALMADIAELFALNKGGVNNGTVGGTADAITFTTVPSPFQSAYAVGQMFLFKPTAVNTVSNPTFTPSGGLAAKTIVLPGSAVLNIPQWGIGDELLLCYDGTSMVLMAGSSVSAFTFSQTLTRNAQTGTTYTILTGDRGKWVTYSNASAVAVTLPQANGTTFGGGWYSYHQNIGVGDVTITPTTSTINSGSGAGTAVVLRTGEWALIETDNTNYGVITNGRVTGAPSVREVGTRGIPVTTQDANASFALSDAGGLWRHTSASTHTWTIPANASVAFPIGTALSGFNEPGGGNLTIAITTDTLNRGDGTAGTGSRTIAANSFFNLVKTAATTWVITGRFT